MISQEIIGPTASPTWRNHTYATTQPCGRSHGNRGFRGYPSLFGFSEQNRDKRYNQIFLSVSLFLSLSCVQAVLVLNGITACLYVCVYIYTVYIYIYIYNQATFSHNNTSPNCVQNCFTWYEKSLSGCIATGIGVNQIGVSQMHYTLQMHYTMYFS